MSTERCALCGEGMDDLSHSPVITAWAKEKGIELASPGSTQLHLRCVRRLRWLITRAIREGK